jgi:hypothetical protein
VRQVGAAASVAPEAHRLVDKLRARLRACAGEAAAATAAAPDLARPRVMFLQSLKPLTLGALCTLTSLSTPRWRNTQCTPHLVGGCNGATGVFMLYLGDC